MVPMEQLHKYQMELERMLTDVTAQLRTIAILDNETGDWTIRTDNIDQREVDSNTLADASEEADERISILSELETKYRTITVSLKKIASGTYGICEISGEPIESKRLDANPAARTCIHHMESESSLPLS